MKNVLFVLSVASSEVPRVFALSALDNDAANGSYVHVGMHL